MKDYLEERDERTTKLYEQMKRLRDSEIENGGENAELFTNVVTELSYRVASKTIESDSGKEKNLCPKCETPAPTTEYDCYCGFCGQFIKK